MKEENLYHLPIALLFILFTFIFVSGGCKTEQIEHITKTENITISDVMVESVYRGPDITFYVVKGKPFLLRTQNKKYRFLLKKNKTYKIEYHNNPLPVGTVSKGKVYLDRDNNLIKKIYNIKVKTQLTERK